MGREGVAYTFVSPEEGNELTRIESGSIDCWSAANWVMLSPTRIRPSEWLPTEEPRRTSRLPPPFAKRRGSRRQSSAS